MTTPPTTHEKPPTRRAASLVVVNTGDGKGKTTAAMGTVLRSLARGWPVCVVQFVKSGKWHSGEVKVLSDLGVAWHVVGDGFSWDSPDLERSAGLARDGWQVAKAAITSDEYRLVLLDEITYPINWRWIDEADVVATIVARPPKVNVILTGRDAPEPLVEIADTVSEVRKIKHAYDAGIRIAKGIDY